MTTRPAPARPPTRIDQVTRLIVERIASQALTPGERLPSIRAFATALGVSPSTIVEAYDRLAADGAIRSRPGSGFYVASRAAPARREAKRDSRLATERAVDPLWVSRQSLDAEPRMHKPGCGWLPSDWMPVDALRRAARALARADDAVLTDYGNTRGSLALRKLLARRAAGDGIESIDQIMLTGSGTQAIDLVCRSMLRPGDTVLVDDPCYFNFRALLQTYRVQVASVPFTTAGPDVAAFVHLLETRRPRLYLTNSALHNPTGATMTARTAFRILQAATAHDLVIVEDDIFADLEPEPSPRFATMDGLDRVIRIGSFSKTLSASVRCGYVVARRDRIEALVDLQVATAFGGASPLAAEMLVVALREGSYHRHLQTLRTRLARARRSTTARLATLGIVPWLAPRGGFFLWCRLPDGADAVAIAKAAVEDRVVLAPGNVFSVAQSAPDFMRFNVAQSDDPQVHASLARRLSDLQSAASTRSSSPPSA